VEDNDCVTGEVCHIKALREGGARYDETQTNSQRNAADNLILLCSRHHTIVDDDPRTYTVPILTALKREAEGGQAVEITPAMSHKAGLLYQQFLRIEVNVQIGTIHAETVTIKTSKRSQPKIVPSATELEGNPDHLAYIQHLIARYQEYAKQQTNREFHFAVIYASVKRQFKASWKHVPISRFDELVSFLQGKIDRTLVGRLNKSQSQSSYESFELYVQTIADVACEPLPPRMPRPTALP